MIEGGQIGEALRPRRQRPGSRVPAAGAGKPLPILHFRTLADGDEASFIATRCEGGLPHFRSRQQRMFCAIGRLGVLLNAVNVNPSTVGYGKSGNVRLC